ncbi:MAG TPA: hypothetical protein VGK19_12555 [Capsulimonadaceae bacterium]|jgi:hypothetical protein
MKANPPWSLQDPFGDGGAVIHVRDLPSSIREDIEDAPFWKEVVAFASIPKSRLTRYNGQYVAIFHGDIVDNDRSEADLARRFYRNHGYVPVYIHRVGVEEALLDIEREVLS